MTTDTVNPGAQEPLSSRQQHDILTRIIRDSIQHRILVPEDVATEFKRETGLPIKPGIVMERAAHIRQKGEIKYIVKSPEQARVLRPIVEKAAKLKAEGKPIKFRALERWLGKGIIKINGIKNILRLNDIVQQSPFGEGTLRSQVAKILHDPANEYLLKMDRPGLKQALHQDFALRVSDSVIGIALERLPNALQAVYRRERGQRTAHSEGKPLTETQLFAQEGDHLIFRETREKLQAKGLTTQSQVVHAAAPIMERLHNASLIKTDKSVRWFLSGVCTQRDFDETLPALAEVAGLNRRQTDRLREAAVSVVQIASASHRRSLRANTAFPQAAGQVTSSQRQEIAAAPEETFRGAANETAKAAEDVQSAEFYEPERHEEYFKKRIKAIKKDAETSVVSITDEIGTLIRQSGRHEDDRAPVLAETRNRDAGLKRQAGLVNQAIDALERIEKGTFGICEDSGEEIPFARLKANPLVTRTIEAQEAHELRERTGTPHPENARAEFSRR